MVQQCLQHIELGLLIFRYQEPEGRREDREILLLPFGISGIIEIGIGKASQMTEAPGYQIAISFQIAIMLIRNTQCGGDGLRHRRLFCNYKGKFTQTVSSVSS